MSDWLGELPNQFSYEPGANSFKSWSSPERMPIFAVLRVFCPVNGTHHEVARESKDTLAVRRGLRHDDSIPILDMYCSANSFPVAPFSRDCSVVSGATLKVLHLPDRGRSIFAD